MKDLGLTKKDIIYFNQEFDKGHFNNESSLDFALGHLKQNISWTRKLAYLIRSILIDHVFEEGNKRTAAAILFFWIEHEGYQIEEKEALGIIKQILKKNITSTKKIKEHIENGITKRNR